jgi:hypothetical protein
VDRLQKRPRNGVSLFLAALAFAAATAMVSTESKAAPVTPTVTSVTVEKAPVQLADEITRRLRRIGISFSRSRLPHPYDPLGEVC